MDASTLINELIEITKKNKNDVMVLKENALNKLNFKINQKKWSALECIEHLNYYGTYYIPEIKNRISKAKHVKSKKFKTGMLGNYFAKSMMPKDTLNKMSTLKATNPTGKPLDKQVLDVFIDQQNELLTLLALAKEVDLTKTKTSISISKWIKLRLGDTLRVVIYHNLRHVNQAKNVIAIAK